MLLKRKAQSITTGATHSGPLFTVFCLWTVVLLGRPQDLFPFLAAVRPALVTGLLTLFLTLTNPKELNNWSLLGNSQTKSFLSLVFIMVIGIPFSLYPRLSFMEIFTGYANVILFFCIFYKVVDSPRKLNSILILGCLGSGLYWVLSLKLGMFIEGRLFFGGMFDANDLAFFALSFLPFNLIYLSRDNLLWLRVMCAGFYLSGLLLILLTGSRGGFVALAISLLMLLLRKTRTISYGMKVTFIVAGLAGSSLFPLDFSRFESLLQIQDDYNVSDEMGRLSLWKMGMRAMLQNPLTGVGVGCFPQAVGMDRQNRDAGRKAWQMPHNMGVQIGTETGVIGLFLFLSMSINTLRIFLRVSRRSDSTQLAKISEMASIGFVGHFVSGMFLSQGYSFYWAFYVVMSAVVRNLHFAVGSNQPSVSSNRDQSH